MFSGSLAAKKEGRKAEVLHETHSADKEHETNWFDCFSSSFDCLEFGSLKCGRPEICRPSTIEVTGCPGFLDTMPYYHCLSDHWQQLVTWHLAAWPACISFLVWVSWWIKALFGLPALHWELLQEDAAACCGAGGCVVVSLQQVDPITQ